MKWIAFLFSVKASPSSRLDQFPVIDLSSTGRRAEKASRTTPSA
jgi:hypothetical protein